MHGVHPIGGARILGRVDTVRRMAKNALIALAALALTVVGGVIAFLVRPSGTPHSEVPVALRAQLDAQTADVAVQLQQADWCVPWVTSCELRCMANVFGMDSRQATTVASVTTAYAVMDCSDRTRPASKPDRSTSSRFRSGHRRQCASRLTMQRNETSRGCFPRTPVPQPGGTTHPSDSTQ